MKPRDLRIEQFEARMLLSISSWVPEGPAPVDAGQTENVGTLSSAKGSGATATNEVVGAIEAVAVNPSNPNVVYVGAVNGGIWETTDALTPDPTWNSQTDKQLSLSIGALSFDPTDGTNQTLLAGIGRDSAFTSVTGVTRQGGALTGILRSTDGGKTWQDPDVQNSLAGKSISGIAGRGSIILVSVDTADSGKMSDEGIFRSTDGGASFTAVSQANGSGTGLPGGKSYGLAADPSNSAIFYTAMVGADTVGGINGIYKSTDSGAHWSKASIPLIDSFIHTAGNAATMNLKISVGANHSVYVGIVNGTAGNSQLAAMFCSLDGGKTWSQMSLPTTTEGGFPFGLQTNGQGLLDFSIQADPTNANLVYVGGDQQPGPLPNSIGATLPTGRLFRGDSSQAAGNQWAPLTDSDTAGGSAPHNDSRGMAFGKDSSGNPLLLEVDEGGIYARTNPSIPGGGDWYSLNGNLQVAEVQSVAYNDVAHVLVGAAQGLGAVEQNAPYTPSTPPAANPVDTWTNLVQGEGGSVAVGNNDPVAGESYVYSSGEYLTGFQRQIVDATNTVLVTEIPALNVVGTFQTFQQIDGGQFYTPVVVNAVNPSWLVIGGATTVFESTDAFGNLPRGDDLVELTDANFNLVPKATSMAYGGFRNGLPNADMLWVTTPTGVYVRNAAGGPLVQTAYPGGPALKVVVDGKDCYQAYVIDSSHVWYTPDMGATWQDITGNYPDPGIVGLHSLAFVPGSSTDPTNFAGAVVVGGPHGAYATQTQGGQRGIWYQVGANLPQAPVYDLQYDSTDDVLLAATLGRGTWELPNARTQVFGTPDLVSVDVNGVTYSVPSGAPTVLQVSPQELLLRFNPNQIIDPTTLSGIEITRAGADGTFFNDPGVSGDKDDVVITPGYIGIGDHPNEVIVRFAQDLPDDLYRVTVVGQGDNNDPYYGPDGKLVAPLRNTAGIAVNGGVNQTWDFTLNLAPQVTSVVPQPVTRVDGVLTQSRNTVDVYFSPGDQVSTNGYSLIVNIDASHVPVVAALDTKTFTITDTNNKKVIFEFVNTFITGRAAGSGHTAVNFYYDAANPADPLNNDINAIRTKIVNAINLAGVQCVATALADGTVSLSDPNVTFNGGNTPFVDVNGYLAVSNIDADHVPYVIGIPSVANLDGKTFQVDAGVTFEFVDSSNPARHAAAGHTAISFNSKNATVASIRTAMITAINAALGSVFSGTGLSCTAVPLGTSNIALYGSNVAPNMGATPFAAQRSVAAMDGQTFLITDSANHRVTFEFVNTAVTGRAAGSGHTAVNFYYNAANPADPLNNDINAIRADVVSAVSKAGLKCTAVQIGTIVALYGSGVAFAAGTTIVNGTSTSLPLVAAFTYLLDPQFFQLIATQGTANTGDDVIINPDIVAYTYNNRQGVNEAVLTFNHDALGNQITDLAQFATGSLRLRVGDVYQPINTIVLPPSSGADISTFGTSRDLTTDLATLDPTDGGYLGGGANLDPVSVVVSGSIGASPYNMMFPGSLDEPGHRDLPEEVGQGLDIENHTSPGAADVGPDGTVTTYTYSFPATYALPSGPAPNLLYSNPALEQSVREMFALFSTYFGVQFQEYQAVRSSTTAAEGIEVILGDPRALGVPGGPTGVGGVAGGGMAIINSAIFSNDDGHFGGGFWTVAMHEILHCLGYGHDYDEPALTVMGAGTEEPGGVTTVGAEPVYPGAQDIINGQLLHRPASIDVDVYKFSVNTRGTFNAETFAERLAEQTDLEQPSLLNTVITLYDQNFNVIARNDDYFAKDSFVQVHLQPGTYYVGISAASATDTNNPQTADSNLGGTTEGAYKLRMGFVPDGAAALTNVSSSAVALDGNLVGSQGGVYNDWFNSQPQSNTLYVDKSATLSSQTNGSISSPYTNIPNALAAASLLVPSQQAGANVQGPVVRIVGNNADNDFGGRGLWNVDESGNAITGAQLVDGETFSISDGTLKVTFEFDSNGLVATGHVRVPFTINDDAATVAKSIFTAINNPQYSDGQGNTLTYALYVQAQMAAGGSAALPPTIILTGPQATFDPGNSPLTNTLTDNLPYEIGYNQNGGVLSDGSNMQVPKDVTVMIDAGAVFKLSGANIQVGSGSQGVDYSLGALQVLGTPGSSVYFTSFLDKSVGHDDYRGTSMPAAGNWGGLVFQNDQDELEGRTVLEQDGIFMDYVNHADISYGGGQLLVNGHLSGQSYSPLYMAKARPTITFNTITYGEGAALSADPDSFQETRFEGNTPQAAAGLYTADYDRSGPLMWGNTLLNNTTNGIFVRVQNQPGAPIQQMDVSARFSDPDMVYVIASNLVIAGNPGGPVITQGTSALTQAGPNLLEGVDGSLIQDGDTFSVNSGNGQQIFQFVLAGDVLPLTGVPVQYAPTDDSQTVAGEIAAAINTAGALASSPIHGLTASVTGDLITVSGASVNFGGLSLFAPRLNGRLAVDPGVIVKLAGSRVQTGPGAQFLAEGTPTDPIILTSLNDNSYGAGGTCDTSNNVTAQASPGDWAGLYFGPASTASIDNANIFYGGGNDSAIGNFDVIEIDQAMVRVANSLLENNAAGNGAPGSDPDREGLGPLEPATISVRGAQPIIINNEFLDNSGPMISIDCNSMTQALVPDWGRSTGQIDLNDAPNSNPDQAYLGFQDHADNYGPLVHGNTALGNGVNGMVVRGGVLDTGTVWDDTDIVHVLYDEITVPNFATFGGVRLQSSPTSSLVVKLLGANAGFTAAGVPLEYNDRIGGEVQVLGTPGHPVVLTSLYDSTVGAGTTPAGQPLTATVTNAPAPSPGDWRGINLEQLSNDRNVATTNQDSSDDANNTPATAQALGSLATTLGGGDSNLRLGFEVDGALNTPTDVDVYSFYATAGTQVWLDLTKTTFSLDSVVELVDQTGTPVAYSDNALVEGADPLDAQKPYTPLALYNQELPGNLARTMDDSDWPESHHFYSTNPRDAALRVVLPGPVGTVQQYFVRISSAQSIGNIDAAHVPVVSALNGENYTVADSNIIAITGVDGAHVPSFAGLDGKTFTITDDLGHVTTYEFV
ncbi:MAG: hypothetical protein ABSG68_13980, partial [Thermoguttaceae bacterium]